MTIDYEDDPLDYLNDADFVYEPWDEDWEDARANPCPDCDYGEVLVTKPRADTPEYVCSDGCGWSA